MKLVELFLTLEKCGFKTNGRKSRNFQSDRGVSFLALFCISRVIELEERWSEVYPPRNQGVFFQKEMFIPGESAWPNPGNTDF